MNNVLNYIAKDIQTKMTRFCIVADFHIEEALNYANRSYDKIVSSNFIIQPMIFKDIHAEGPVRITLRDVGGCVYREINIRVELRHNYWTGGQNGFDFAKFMYLLKNKDYMNGNVKGMECEYVIL